MSHRIQQVNELIKQELNELLIKEGFFSKESLVTITNVITSKDLSQAKIYISILPAEEGVKVLLLLKDKAGYLQHLLGKRMVIRKIPKLLFYKDQTQGHVSHIDDLIDKIRKER